MPTIEASSSDLLKLIGKSLSDAELEKVLLSAKSEFSNLEKGQIKIEVADVNRPDLLSIEGIARQCRLSLGIISGLQKYNIHKTAYRINAKSNLRPYIAAAVIRNLKLNEDSIKQLIQLQEKLCEIFGRKRKEAALGIYDFDKISWPIKYSDESPEKIRFIPISMEREMTGKEIIIRHPTGIKYSALLEKENKYPFLIDSKNNVLSMPPIINSNYSGKVTEKTKNLFIEVTGHNERFVLPILNTIVTALADRGGKIESVNINNRIFPSLNTSKCLLSIEEVNSVIGTSLSSNEIIKLLKKSGYNAYISKDIENRTNHGPLILRKSSLDFRGVQKCTDLSAFLTDRRRHKNSSNICVFDYISKKNILNIEIPVYRQDILDTRDIIEDIAISFGYNNLRNAPPNIISTGAETIKSTLSRKIAELIIGLGYQEIATQTLTSKEVLFKKMNKQENGIEIANPISELYTNMRPELLSSMLSFLSKNKTSRYPQDIFEIGNIIDKNGNDRLKLCIASCSAESNFTIIKQILDYLSANLNFSQALEASKHSEYIGGRQADIMINGKSSGNLGEISPVILNNFGIEFPVSALEIELESLMNLYYL